MKVPVAVAVKLKWHGHFIWLSNSNFQKPHQTFSLNNFSFDVKKCFSSDAFSTPLFELSVSICFFIQSIPCPQNIVHGKIIKLSLFGNHKEGIQPCHYFMGN